MKVKEYINKIVDNGKKEYMDELSNMLSELVYNSPKKHEYKMELYGMANDYKFDREMAEELVESMNPYGEYWDYDTTERVRMQYGMANVSPCDFYIVMNSLVNDYNEVISPDNVETYVKMTKAFIQDEDAVDNKIWKYFNNITKN